MKLDDAQKLNVTTWIAEGLKLSDIQKRLGSELGLTLTYMEVRMLVDDLKVMPKDPAPPPAPKLPAGGAAAEGLLGGGGADKPALPSLPAEPAAGALGGVAVTVHTVARPGSLVSGGVKFSDGQSAVWQMDQMGRLGLAPSQPGYKPSAADVQAFQDTLEKELSKLGL